MFNFIISYRKVFDIKTFRNPEQFIKEFMELYIGKLNNSYIKNIKKQKTKVKFEAPLGRFTWNAWNLFNPVSKGEIKFTVKQGKPRIHIQYKYTEFFIVALLLTPLIIVAFSLGLAFWGILIFIADWILFYIGSRIISSFRITSYISVTAQEINNIDEPSKEIPTPKYDPDSYLKEEWSFFEQVFLWKRNPKG